MGYIEYRDRIDFCKDFQLFPHKKKSLLFLHYEDTNERVTNNYNRIQKELVLLKRGCPKHKKELWITQRIISRDVLSVIITRFNFRFGGLVLKEELLEVFQSLDFQREKEILISYSQQESLEQNQVDWHLKQVRAIEVDYRFL